MSSDVECQTTIQCIQDNGTVHVQSDAVCQTFVTIVPDETDVDLINCLKYVDPSEIETDSQRSIDIPRKARLQFVLPENNKSKEVNIILNDIFKKVTNQRDSIDSGLVPILRMAGLKHSRSFYRDAMCQTVLMVSPHMLKSTERAVVSSDYEQQTMISCEPKTSLSEVIPKLKARLVHDSSLSSIGDTIQNESILDIILDVIEKVEQSHMRMFDPNFQPPEIPPELSNISEHTANGNENAMREIIDQVIDELPIPEQPKLQETQEIQRRKIPAFKISIIVHNVENGQLDTNLEVSIVPDVPAETEARVCQCTEIKAGSNVDEIYEILKKVYQEMKMEPCEPRTSTTKSQIEDIQTEPEELAKVQEELVSPQVNEEETSKEHSESDELVNGQESKKDQEEPEKLTLNGQESEENQKELEEKSKENQEVEEELEGDLTLTSDQESKEDEPDVEENLNQTGIHLVPDPDSKLDQTVNPIEDQENLEEDLTLDLDQTVIYRGPNEEQEELETSSDLNLDKITNLNEDLKVSQEPDEEQPLLQESTVNKPRKCAAYEDFSNEEQEKSVTVEDSELKEFQETQSEEEQTLIQETFTVEDNVEAEEPSEKKPRKCAAYESVTPQYSKEDQEVEEEQPLIQETFTVEDNIEAEEPPVKKPRKCAAYESVTPQYSKEDKKVEEDQPLIQEPFTVEDNELKDVEEPKPEEEQSLSQDTFTVEDSELKEVEETQPEEEQPIRESSAKKIKECAACKSMITTSEENTENLSEKLPEEQLKIQRPSKCACKSVINKENNVVIQKNVKEAEEKCAACKSLKTALENVEEEKSVSDPNENKNETNNQPSEELPVKKQCSAIKHRRTKSVDLSKKSSTSSKQTQTTPVPCHCKPETVKIQTDLVLGSRLLSTSLNSVSDEDYETCSEGPESARSGKRDVQLPWERITFPGSEENPQDPKKLIESKKVEEKVKTPEVVTLPEVIPPIEDPEDGVKTSEVLTSLICPMNFNKPCSGIKQNVAKRPCSCKSLQTKEPKIFYDLTPSYTSSFDSKSICSTSLKKPEHRSQVSFKLDPISETCSTSTPKQDPVVHMLSICEAELKPIQNSLNEVKQKLKSLNIPELNCIFNNPTTPVVDGRIKTVFRTRLPFCNHRSTQSSKSILVPQRKDEMVQVCKCDVETDSPSTSKSFKLKRKASRGHRHHGNKPCPFLNVMHSILTMDSPESNRRTQLTGKDIDSFYLELQLEPD